MADISSASYKELQQQFVSNLNGTSVLEVGIVASTAPVAAILRSFVFNALFSKRGVHPTKRMFSW